MVDLNAHEAGNGGKKPRDAYSLPSLLYSEIPSGRCWFLPREDIISLGLKKGRSTPKTACSGAHRRRQRPAITVCEVAGMSPRGCSARKTCACDPESELCNRQISHSSSP